MERPGDGETNVYRVDLVTGRREPHLKIAPSDTLGLEFLGGVRITPDGRSYVYSLSRCTSDLYLVEGVR